MTVRRKQHETKDGVVEAWSYDFAVGKVRYRKSGFAKKSDALEAEARLKGDVCTSGHRTIKRPNVLFKDIAPAFLESRRSTNASTTCIAEVGKLGLISRRLGHLRLCNIDHDCIEDYVSAREAEGVSGRTINIELTLLSVFFDYAIKHKYITPNPVRDVARRDGTAKEKWCPSPEEFSRYVEAFRKKEFGWYILPWVQFRAYSGVRPRESLFLHWSDIDLERDFIYIRRKGKDEERGEPANNLKNRAAVRTIPIHPKLKPILIEWRKTWEEFFVGWQKRHPGERHTPSVFFSPRHPTKRAKSFYKPLDEVRRETGLLKMDNYTMRHFCISRCVECGIELFTVAKWVGHKNTRMIEEVYGHLSPRFKKAEMARLNIDTYEPAPASESPLPVVSEDISKVDFDRASARAS